ncbi:MAG: MFS transporter [Acidiferrobacterales bacterium]|nr:MFS transporter [Acidiferrobacterales bacterium]
MKSKYQEFSYAWRVVIASAVGIGLGLSPIPIYTLGVFALPLAEEFGWGIDKVMLALPILTICSLLLAPLVGLLVDKVGVRKVAITSVFMFSSSLMLHALNPGSYTYFLAMWAVVAVCGIGTLPITWTRAINHWFHDCRGLALGSALVATGLFGIVAKLYVASMIEAYGWRTAFVGLGMLPLLIALPVAWFFFRDVDDPSVPEEKLPVMMTGSVNHLEQGHSTKGAFADWRFWLLCICFVVISFGVGGTIPNMENLMGSKGFERGDAIILASLIGYSVMVGRIAGGYLIDRFWAPIIALCLLILPAISCYILMQPSYTFMVAAIAILLIGLAAGAEQDLMAFLVARYFGMKNYGVIYGCMYAAFALGAGMGPYIFGRAYAQTGTYDNMLMYAGIAFVCGSIPLLTLGKYRYFNKD